MSEANPAAVTIDAITLEPVFPKSSERASHFLNTITGPGVIRNRHRNSVTTRERVTFNASDNIKEVEVSITSTGVATATAKLDHVLAVVANAISDTHADALLAETDNEATDVMYEQATIDKPAIIRSINPITRLDFRRIDGGDTLRVFIKARGAG